MLASWSTHSPSISCGNRGALQTGLHVPAKSFPKVPPVASTSAGKLALRCFPPKNPLHIFRSGRPVLTRRRCQPWPHRAAASDACHADEDRPAPAPKSWSPVLKDALRKAVGVSLLFAVGVLGAARPAAADPARHRQPASAGVQADEASFSGRDAAWHSAAGKADATGQSEASKSRRWETGFQLAAAVDEAEEEELLLEGDENQSLEVKGAPTVVMTPDEQDDYYLQEFGDDPKYSRFFGTRKKPKKIDVLKSFVPDPAAWDTPEFEPVTRWRVDRMKDLTYTQLWFLIKERKVDNVKFSNDSRMVWVTTKDHAPGGRRTEKVALPFDPDLYHHMIEHGVSVEVPDANFFLDNIAFGCMYLVWPVIVGVVLFMTTVNMNFAPKANEEKLFEGAKLDRLNESKQRLTFGDIAGIDDVKSEVEELVAFLRNPKRFTDLGARAPAGVLLVGNPGTGKTLLAKAIAGEAGVPFLSVAGTEFDQLFVGVGAARVRDMFRQARECAPCILFIDEFDGIGKKRSLSAASESANTINSLLTEMDGFEDNSGVIVIAATNRPGALDSALTRPGRFDRLITLPLPSIDGRTAILKVHARGKKLAPNVSFNKIARATAGFTGAQLMNVMNTAAVVAVRRKAVAITTDDMLTALEQIQQEDYSPVGTVYADDQAPAPVRRGVALYEAARALIGTITPFYDEVSKVVCCPGGSTMGYTHFIPQEEQLESRVVTRAYMEAKIVVTLAGRAAERLVLGEAHISTAGATHVELANFIARDMIYKCGFSKRLGPVVLQDSQSGFLRGQAASYSAAIGTELAAIGLTEVLELLEAAEAKASFGLAVNYSALEALTEKLMENESMTGEQVTSLLKAHGVKTFPDPFIDGFGWDPDGNLIYPGKPAQQEAAGFAKRAPKEPAPEVTVGSRTFRLRKDLPPYPYRVRDDLQDLIGDELKVLERM